MFYWDDRCGLTKRPLCFPSTQATSAWLRFRGIRKLNEKMNSCFARFSNSQSLQAPVLLNFFKLTTKKLEKTAVFRWYIILLLWWTTCWTQTKNINSFSNLFFLCLRIDFEYLILFINFTCFGTILKGKLETVFDCESIEIERLVLNGCLWYVNTLKHLRIRIIYF